METLKEYVDAFVQIITIDGKVIVGKLRGFDQVTNLILEKCEERAFSTEEGVARIPLGLQVIRGQCISAICGIDEEKDDNINFDEIRAQPIDLITWQ
ncbi:U4/U6-U5 snRNP complex subunit LSM8 [Sorochytrium milnesiophthora]